MGFEGPPQRLVFGRRRGRGLRPGRRALAAELLPRLSFSLPPGGRLDPHALFGLGPRIWLEIGFGAGEHLAAQAASRPDVGFIGCEVFESGIARLLGEIERRSLANIRIFGDDARLLLNALPPASVDRAFILFPDPWPKRRHRKRRIVSGESLDRLAEIMTDGAELRLATDDGDYLCWMLERAILHPAFEWLARRPDDWRQRPADWPPTRYEEKAGAAGRKPYFLRFRRRFRRKIAMEHARDRTIKAEAGQKMIASREVVNPSEEIATLPRYRMLELVRSILVKNSVDRPPAIDEELGKAGLSSIDMVNLMLAVEAEFEITIPAAEITPANFRSIASIEALILKLARSGSAG